MGSQGELCYYYIVTFEECYGLYVLGPGSGTIRRCGLVGVDVVLLEWVWPGWSGRGLVRVGVVLLGWAWPCWSGYGLVGVGVALLE